MQVNACGQNGGQDGKSIDESACRTSRKTNTFRLAALAVYLGEGLESNPTKGTENKAGTPRVRRRTDFMVSVFGNRVCKPVARSSQMVLALENDVYAMLLDEMIDR